VDPEGSLAAAPADSVTSVHSGVRCIALDQGGVDGVNVASSEGDSTLVEVEGVSRSVAAQRRGSASCRQGELAEFYM